MSQQDGDGFVVASSRRIVRGGASPPSFHAKNRYLKILARGGLITEDVRDRFLCTGGDEDDGPAHVVFNLNVTGPTLAARWKPGAASYSSGSSVGRGGGYG